MRAAVLLSWSPAGMFDWIHVRAGCRIRRLADYGMAGSNLLKSMRRRRDERLRMQEQQAHGGTPHQATVVCPCIILHALCSTELVF